MELGYNCSDCSPDCGTNGAATRLLHFGCMAPLVPRMVTGLGHSRTVQQTADCSTVSAASGRQQMGVAAAQQKGGGRRRVSSKTPPVARGQGSRSWGTSRRASATCTHHVGPAVGQHQALGSRSTRGNPTLRPSPNASDTAITQRRHGAHERLPTIHIAWWGLRVPDLL